MQLDWQIAVESLTNPVKNYYWPKLSPDFKDYVNFINNFIHNYYVILNLLLLVTFLYLKKRMIVSKALFLPQLLRK